MDEERKRKSSQARIDANLRYKRKGITKTLEFKVSEKQLVDYAEQKAQNQGKSFQGYVKDLLRADMNQD